MNVTGRINTQTLDGHSALWLKDGGGSVQGHGVWGGKETGDQTVTGFVPWSWPWPWPWPLEAFPASVPSTADSLEVQLTVAWRKGRTEGRRDKGMEAGRDRGMEGASRMSTCRATGLVPSDVPFWTPLWTLELACLDTTIIQSFRRQVISLHECLQFLFIGSPVPTSILTDSHLSTH